MTREEFSQMLVAARESQGMTRGDVARASGLTAADVVRFEKGSGSGSMSAMLACIKGMSHDLYLRHDNHNVKIATYNTFVKYIAKQINGRPLLSLAHAVGCTQPTLNNLLSLRSIVRCDLALRLLVELGVELQIQPKPNSKQPYNMSPQLTREQFSTMLVEARKGCKKTMAGVALTVGVTPPHIHRIETAKNNYSIKKALEYLQAISYQMLFISKGASQAILDYDNVVAVIEKHRLQNKYTQRDMVKKIGCSDSTVINFESKKTVVSIDILLRILHVLNIELQIKPINNEQ